MPRCLTQSSGRHSPPLPAARLTCVAVQAGPAGLASCCCRLGLHSATGAALGPAGRWPWPVHSGYSSCGPSAVASTSSCTPGCRQSRAEQTPHSCSFPPFLYSAGRRLCPPLQLLPTTPGASRIVTCVPLHSRILQLLCLLVSLGQGMELVCRSGGLAYRLTHSCQH